MSAAFRVPPGLSQLKLLLFGRAQIWLTDWRGVVGSEMQDNCYHLSWATRS
jgi:hypothetical protein